MVEQIRDNIIAIIFLIIGIGISTLVLIFISVLSGGIYTNTQSYISVLSTEVTNESSSAIPSVPATVTVSNTPVYPGTESIYSWFDNDTGYIGALTKDVNYTVTDYSAGQFSITDLNNLNSSDTKVNVSYTYGNPTIEGNITGAIQTSFTSLKTTGDYLPIVVLAVIIFIILGMVMTMTPRGQGYIQQAL